jgi:peptidoglycan/LPS O-acetylase OafA/YrhL
LKNKFETGNYYPGIDSLRGLAIVLVLIYHNLFYLEITWYGQFGVDLFFVISGFLITDTVKKHKFRKVFDKFLWSQVSENISNLLSLSCPDFFHTPRSVTS